MLVVPRPEPCDNGKTIDKRRDTLQHSQHQEASEIQVRPPAAPASPSSSQLPASPTSASNTAGDCVSSAAVLISGAGAAAGTASAPDKSNARSKHRRHLGGGEVELNMVLSVTWQFSLYEAFQWNGVSIACRPESWRKCGLIHGDHADGSLGWVVYVWRQGVGGSEHDTILVCRKRG